MIGVDLPEGIYHIRVAVQAEYLSLRPTDGELALFLNVLDICEVQGLVRSVRRTFLPLQ
jgi:hypothetical protein